VSARTARPATAGRRSAPPGTSRPAASVIRRPGNVRSRAASG